MTKVGNSISYSQNAPTSPRHELFPNTL